MAEPLSDLFDHGDEFALCDRLFVRNPAKTRGNGAGRLRPPGRGGPAPCTSCGARSAYGNGGLPRGPVRIGGPGRPGLSTHPLCVRDNRLPRGGRGVLPSVGILSERSPPGQSGRAASRVPEKRSVVPLGADRAFFAAQDSITKSLANWARSRQRALMHLA